MCLSATTVMLLAKELVCLWMYELWWKWGGIFANVLVELLGAFV